MTFQIPPYALYYDDEAAIRDQYWTPESGDWVLDIGARYGSYTLPALAAGARVVAVDPHQQIMGLLRSAVEENGFQDRFDWVCAAVLDDEPYPDELAAEIGEVWPAGDVQFTTIDKIADGAPLDWIKIDVEGVELQVLKGGLETLKAHHPKLLIEDHTRVYPWCEANETGQRVRNLLRSLDYEVVSVPYEADTGSPRDFTVAT